MITSGLRRLPRSIPARCACFVLWLALPCNATPNFPAVVAQVSGASGAPACTICHNNPNGGLGTATTPFAGYLRSRGLVPYDESSLKAALAADQAENHDTDSDGTPDIEALNQGLHPNGNLSAAPPPVYGCALTRVHTRRGNNTVIRYGVFLSALASWVES